jgi:hypothetical protein
MLFHPGPEQPTAPNAGILQLAPGAHHPEHDHGFAQVWFILKGALAIDGRLCPPGTMLYLPDPHFEDAFHTETGSIGERDCLLDLQNSTTPKRAVSRWQRALRARHRKRKRQTRTRPLNWRLLPDEWRLNSYHRPLPTARQGSWSGMT